LNAESFLKDIVDSGKLKPMPDIGLEKFLKKYRRFSDRADRATIEREHYLASRFAKGMQSCVSSLSYVANKPDRKLGFAVSHVTERMAYPREDEYSSYFGKRFRVVLNLSPAVCDQSRLWFVENTFNNKVGFVRLQGIAVELEWPWELERFQNQVSERRHTPVGALPPHHEPSQPVLLRLLFQIREPNEFAWVTIRATGQADYTRLVAKAADIETLRAHEDEIATAALCNTVPYGFELACEKAEGALGLPCIDMTWLADHLYELGHWVSEVDCKLHNSQRKLGSIVF
jgi:hypothetical protein